MIVVEMLAKMPFVEVRLARSPIRGNKGAKDGQMLAFGIQLYRLMESRCTGK
jgi:hypothetical protein